MLGGLFKGLFGSGGEGTAAQAVSLARQRAGDVRFQPYTVRTSAGETAYDPTTGQYTTQLSGPLQQLLTQATSGASGLFQAASDFDIDTRAEELFGEQARLLEDPFAQQRQQTAEALFRTGRGGLRISGEAVGAGEGSGMVQPEAYGLSRAQSQVLASLAPQARQQAIGEQQALLGMGLQQLGAGLNLAQLENTFMNMGLTAEQARSAAELSAANLELAPMLSQAQLQQQSRGQTLGFFGSLLAGAMMPGAGGAGTGSLLGRAIS